MIPLWCKSNASFLEGASHPRELVEAAHRLGHESIALTDRDGVYGMVEAHTKAKELGMHLICGAEMSLANGVTVVLLVMNRVGWSSLCKLITVGRLRSDKGACVLAGDEVAMHNEGLLLLLPPTFCAQADDTALLQSAFADHIYAMLPRHLREVEVSEEIHTRAWARARGIPVVATIEVLYHDRARQPLADIVACIRHGVTLAEAGTRIRGNAKHALLSASECQKLFADDHEAQAQSYRIAERCTFSLAELRYTYPLEPIPTGMTVDTWLRVLVERGAHERYGEVLPDAVVAQIRSELLIISDLAYGGYFLTMYEIVCFCVRENILCQGRGSAANSIVCYCLGITAVDPIRYGFLFERFLSRERAEAPDIDLDISHQRREEVIRFVYQRYGRNRAAMLANVIRYRSKSAIRDVGKVLGYSLEHLDRLAKQVSWSEGLTAEMVEYAQIDGDTELAKHLLHWSAELLGFPRHLSIHPGGFLLTCDDIDSLVPVENGAMEGRTVIQWDKYDIEEMGWFKVDLLGLGALTHLSVFFDLLKAHRGVELSLRTLPQEDPKTYDMICSADTVGVFQIESRAQMSMLPRLLPRTYYDLVIQVAIVRPGPITGKMVHPYLRRRKGTEPVVYPHPSLRPALEKTLGVPLFQEQVIRLAMIAADYTPGEADQLRRDMAAWQRTGRIDSHRERLVSRMMKKGIPAEFAERVFEQIRGFGEYGFPESHAASFALISYATAYIRAHYLPECTCALLNAMPMGFYSVATIVEDAKRHGLQVLPIDVQRSHWPCTLESQALRMGMSLVQGLSLEHVAHAVSAAPFAGLLDFVRRTQFDLRSLEMLAKAGALESLGCNRRTALWEIGRLVTIARDPFPLALLEGGNSMGQLSFEEQLEWDYEVSGHSTQGHPMAALRSSMQEFGIPTSAQLRAQFQSKNTVYVGFVICRQRPGTAAGVVFLTMEDEFGFVNVVIWKTVFERYARLIKGASLLGIRGKLQTEDGVTHLFAQHVFLPRLKTKAAVSSRDFH